MTLRIVTYNLLVPAYAELPDNYFKSKPEVLKTAYRLNLIQKEFEREINQYENTIICVQELSLTMLPALELFFRRVNYTFFSNLYGESWNSYMGVGIAIPNKMQLVDISYIKIGDHLRSVCKRRGDTKSEPKDLAQDESDPWETSINRSNTLVCLKVIIDGRTLCIGTYHMPCYYKEPSVMAIHSSTVKDLMFQLANGNACILAGDFNFEPKDTAYRAVIEKGYRDVHYPTTDKYDVSYQPNIEQVMKSAYREKNGSEPPFTNLGCTNGSPVYCGTLDYIFYTDQLFVEDVLQLPEKPTSDSYPDETHPSDHLMLAATFRLEYQSKI